MRTGVFSTFDFRYPAMLVDDQSTVSLTTCRPARLKLAYEAGRPESRKRCLSALGNRLRGAQVMTKSRIEVTECDIHVRNHDGKFHHRWSKPCQTSWPPEHGPDELDCEHRRRPVQHRESISEADALPRHNPYNQ
jgi:hypothetical protein